MKIILEGDIVLNQYYVQTLCMIFFPGAKFSVSEEITETTPVATIAAYHRGDGVYCTASIKIGEKIAAHTHFEAFRHDRTADKTAKIASGIAVVGAGEKMFAVTPPWGILTGVRPSKIATELQANGHCPDEIRRILTEEYFVNPKKAALATDVAISEQRIIRTLPADNRSCSVYISIPFCPTRCAYCSFVSYSTKRLLSLIPAYLQRLCGDIDRTFQTIRKLGLRVLTIYIGGGTPTILNEEQLGLLLSKVSENLCADGFASLREYTLEAGRPDTVTAEKLKIAKQYGITRISINPQTLNDTVLQEIGRRHTVEDFFNAYHIARESGIKYINTDFIAGLPGEKFASFSKGVDTILQYKPDNITFHTFCAKKSADILKSDTDIYSIQGGDAGKSVDYSQLMAKNTGYIPYYMYRQKNTVGNFENVGFSLPGAEGLYNIFIMEELHSIFAVGAGAITKLVCPEKNKIERLFMPKYPYEYLDMEKKDAGAIEKFFAQIDSFYRE